MCEAPWLWILDLLTAWPACTAETCIAWWSLAEAGTVASAAIATPPSRVVVSLFIRGTPRELRTEHIDQFRQSIGSGPLEGQGVSANPKLICSARPNGFECRVKFYSGAGTFGD